MLFKSVVTAALAAAIIAQPLQDEHQHHHQHEKRAVKVVTEFETVVVTAGYGGDEIPTSSVSLKPATDVTVASSSTHVAQLQPESFSNPTTFATSITSSIATSSTSAPTETGNSGDESPASNGGAKGITYSPYSDDGGCKSYNEIAADLAKLTNYDLIRIYGVDCDQANAVLANIASHQKVFAGIFDVADIEGGVKTLASAVESNGGWGVIDTVSVGNELVNGGQASVDEVNGYVKKAKSALQSAGYDGPVVTTDTFIAVINNPGLCDASDYMAVNAHAFFDGYFEADQAGEWVLQQIQRVYTACGGKKRVFVTETGWPSKGDSNGKAVPSVENQKAAVDSISKVCGDASILFTAFNDFWKAPGSFNAEQYWGIHSN